MRHLILAIAAFALSSCAAMTGISNKYPRQWPDRLSEKGSTCPDISGTYENSAGFSHNPYGAPGVLLTRFLLNLGHDYEEESIRFQFDPATRVSQVEVIGKDTSQIPFADRLDPAQVTCKDGIVWFRMPSQSAEESLTGYVSRTRLGLQKTADGSLIGQERTVGVGHFLIVPVGGSQTFWYRWIPVSASMANETKAMPQPDPPAPR
jgi:hypothetical protein